MAKKTERPVEESGHGRRDLPSVAIESYNLEIKDDDGFIGDKASKGAFLDLLDAHRALVDDPLDIPTAGLGKKRIDELLREGTARQAAVVLGATERFAERLAMVLRRYAGLKAWGGAERVVIGGGFRQSRVGEIAIARAEAMLRERDVAIELIPICHHPDEAGLIGCAHLAPAWIFAAYDSIVAVDIGGSNIRCGIVRLHLDKAADLSEAEVWRSELWRHADEDPKRDEAVDRLGDMLRDLIAAACKNKLKLAPFIGVGCPGIINDDGTIERGAQNLPGNWESSRFNLVTSIRSAVPAISQHETMVLLHNDAVVQGLSETPKMQDVERWGVLTIGTGLGNASFANRRKAAD